jgi:hypothetical protein
MLRNAISSDRVYIPNVDDLAITTINGFVTDGQKFWSLWVNFKYIQTSIGVGSVPPNVGAGQVRIRDGDNVLWAYIPVFSAQGIATSWSTRE